MTVLLPAPETAWAPHEGAGDGGMHANPGEALTWLRLPVLTRRLLTGLVTLLGLVLASGIISLYMAANFENVVAQVVQRHVQGAVYLSTANDALWRLRYQSPQFMVGNADERDRILAEEPLLYKQISTQLELYAATITSDVEREAFETLQKSYLRYIDARPKWHELYAAGRIDEARDYRASTTTPFGAEAVANIERQLQLHRRLAQEAFDKARDDAARWKQYLVLTLAAAMLTAVALFALGSRALLRLRKLHMDAVSIATRLFGPQAASTSGDEVDALAASFDAMTRQYEAHTDKLELTHAKLKDAVAQMEHQAVGARALHEVSDRLQACQTIDEAKVVFATFAPQLFPATRGRLYVINASHGIADCFAEWGTPVATKNTHFSPAECWALRRSLVHTSGAGFNDLRCPHIDAASSAATVCVPIMSQGSAIGLLSIEPPPGGEADTVSTAVAAGNVVGMTLANLRLHENLRTQSIVDPLTGLYNRRFMDETLEREVMRSKRQGLPLAVLMADIDHFKRFNDTHGHDAGDCALRDVAASMRSMFRASDIICRFGGEEFLIILPDADAPTAVGLADAWRTSLVRQPLIALGGMTLPPVAASVGVAVFPEHGRNAEELIRAADEALYSAKRSGRNRVVVATADRPDGRARSERLVTQ